MQKISLQSVVKLCICEKICICHPYKSRVLSDFRAIGTRWTHASCFPSTAYIRCSTNTVHSFCNRTEQPYIPINIGIFPDQWDWIDEEKAFDSMYPLEGLCRLINRIKSFKGKNSSRGSLTYPTETLLSSTQPTYRQAHTHTHTALWIKKSGIASIRTAPTKTTPRSNTLRGSDANAQLGRPSRKTACRKTHSWDAYFAHSAHLFAVRTNVSRHGDR